MSIVKPILFFYIFILTTNCFGQDNVSIYQPKMLFFYWGIGNEITYNKCSQCDSIILSGSALKIDQTNEFSGIVYVANGTRITSVYSTCFFNGEVRNIDTTEVKAGPLPKPNIALRISEFLLYFEFNEDGFEEFKMTQIQKWNGIHLSKNELLPLNLKYEVGAWSIVVSGNSFLGEGADLSEEVIEALTNAQVGDTVTFRSVEYKVVGTDYSLNLKLNKSVVLE